MLIIKDFNKKKTLIIYIITSLYNFELLFASASSIFQLFNADAPVFYRLYLIISIYVLSSIFKLFLLFVYMHLWKDNINPNI